jgi:hypothetical protein
LNCKEEKKKEKKKEICSRIYQRGLRLSCSSLLFLFVVRFVLGDDPQRNEIPPL